MTKNIENKIDYFQILSGLFITTLIISNIASIKLTAIGPFSFDAGTILFPLAYVLGDIITEVYGFKRMRQLIVTGAAMLLLMSLAFWIVGILPSASEWTNQAAYDAILGVVWRIVFASLTAITVGEILNSYVLVRLKARTNGKKLWLRLISSSALGALVDTIIFSTLAFAGTMPFSSLASLIVTVFVIKILTEIVISPLTMFVIKRIKSA